MYKVLWLGCLSYFVIGVAHIIGGSILEQLVTYYGQSYAAGGQWIMNQFLGFLVGVLLAPLVQQKIGQRATLIVALAMLTVAQIGYSIFLPWGLMLAIAPLAGVGFGVVEAVLGSMIIDLFKEKRASAMSRLEVFFGLGALGIPLVSAVLISQGQWKLAFPILAVMCVLTLICWVFLSFGKQVDEQLKRPAQTQQKTTLKYTGKTKPILIIGMVFFFLYVGMEMSFSNYLPSILLQKTTFDESRAAAMLGLFWGFMVVGRLFCGYLADKYGYMKYLLISMFIAVVACFGLVYFEGNIAILAMIALAGIGFSGVFGIALVYVNVAIPGLTNRTTSLLIACGGIGGALLPKATGLLMDHASVYASLLSFAFAIAGMFIVLIVLGMLGRKQLKIVKVSETDVATPV